MGSIKLPLRRYSLSLRGFDCSTPENLDFGGGSAGAGNLSTVARTVAKRRVDRFIFVRQDQAVSVLSQSEIPASPLGSTSKHTGRNFCSVVREHSARNRHSVARESSTKPSAQCRCWMATIGVFNVKHTTAMKAYCHGDPAFHERVLPSNPVYAVACRFFEKNPDMRFYMVRVRRDELRALLRVGAAGVYGHPRLTMRDDRFPRHFGFTFPVQGRMWVVFCRDWCRTDFLPHLDERYRPGWVLLPQLPATLSALPLDEADALGECLWRTWEGSAGKTAKAARLDADVAIRTTYALWGQ